MSMSHNFLHAAEEGRFVEHSCAKNSDQCFLRDCGCGPIQCCCTASWLSYRPKEGFILSYWQARAQLDHVICSLSYSAEEGKFGAVLPKNQTRAASAGVVDPSNAAAMLCVLVIHTCNC